MILRNIICLLVVCSVSIFGQQVPDPNFDVKVGHPAFSPSKQPKVLFDEGHSTFTPRRDGRGGNALCANSRTTAG